MQKDKVSGNSNWDAAGGGKDSLLGLSLYGSNGHHNNEPLVPLKSTIMKRLSNSSRQDDLFGLRGELAAS